MARCVGVAHCRWLNIYGLGITLVSMGVLERDDSVPGSLPVDPTKLATAAFAAI